MNFFSGQGTEPWQPDCVDYAPLNVYGESKLGGFRNRDLPAGGHGCERRSRDHCRIRSQQGRAPFNSRLDRGKLVENGFEPLPDWRDAAGRYLKSIGDQGKAIDERCG